MLDPTLEDKALELAGLDTGEEVPVTGEEDETTAEELGEEIIAEEEVGEWDGTDTEQSGQLDEDEKGAELEDPETSDKEAEVRKVEGGAVLVEERVSMEESRPLEEAEIETDTVGDKDGVKDEVRD